MTDIYPGGVPVPELPPEPEDLTPARDNPAPPGRPASVRPGPHVPPPDPGELPPPEHDLWRNLNEARDLFETCPTTTAAMDDAGYHRLVPGLRDLHHRLMRIAREKIDDDELFDLMLEVRSYLRRDQQQ